MSQEEWEGIVCYRRKIAENRALVIERDNGERFKFPFFTIENVDLVDDKHIVVGNDNNLPYSSSREPNQADDNEMILLNVESLLKLK